jgi:uracil-DNA glycosylase
MPGTMLIGEAWGRVEEEQKAPFVGPTGMLLNGFLRATGIDRSRCFVTNVFNLRPPGGDDITNLCGFKADGIPGYPPISMGRYIRAEFEPELHRLYEEVRRFAPTLIIALGATAAWAVLRTSSIRNIRGAPMWSELGHKVLPTYHPSAVSREPKLRPIFYADLKKAAVEATFPELRFPKREIWIKPSLRDLDEFEERYIVPSCDLSIDCETYGEQITCIAFAPLPSVALVVPFLDPMAPGNNYWPTLADEVRVWRWVKRICSLNKRIVGQNLQFDMTYLWRSYGIPVPHAAEDTMLLHHSLQPEMEKSLGFLASIFTTEQSWKWMRTSSTVKRED